VIVPSLAVRLRLVGVAGSHARAPKCRLLGHQTDLSRCPPWVRLPVQSGSRIVRPWSPL